MITNRELRKRIVDIVHRSGEGHIPSSFSVVEIISILYREFLRYDPLDPSSENRDFFILSKGHSAAALFAVLEELELLKRTIVDSYSLGGSILGGHPDRTKVPFVEASTGSLGHGLPMAVGIAMGIRVQGRDNKVIALVGDGETNEGTTWESALVGANRRLGNLCVVVDWNESAMQLNPDDDQPNKWKSFGWDVVVTDGHDDEQLRAAFLEFYSVGRQTPLAVVAKTTKGKGVPFIEGHGAWHHKIPTGSELGLILEHLDA